MRIGLAAGSLAFACRWRGLRSPLFKHASVIQKFVLS
jgi:hypothetical protein